MTTAPEPKRFRAAQYVRMSTDHQQYSTQNQADKIAEYAHFSDRGRLFQRDRGRRFSAIVDARRCAQAKG